jgi:hypothetical protein
MSGTTIDVTTPDGYRWLLHGRPTRLAALMLPSGMSLQRLARIQGHSIRVLDETYFEELAEFQDRGARIDRSKRPLARLGDVEAEHGSARPRRWQPMSLAGVRVGDIVCRDVRGECSMPW